MTEAPTTFHARVEKGELYWVAQLDEDPGVITQARTREGLIEMLRDALTLFPELTSSPDTATIILYDSPA